MDTIMIILLLYDETDTESSNWTTLAGPAIRYSMYNILKSQNVLPYSPKFNGALVIVIILIKWIYRKQHTLTTPRSHQCDVFVSCCSSADLCVCAGWPKDGIRGGGAMAAKRLRIRIGFRYLVDLIVFCVFAHHSNCSIHVNDSIRMQT